MDRIGPGLQGECGPKLSTRRDPVWGMSKGSAPCRKARQRKVRQDDAVQEEVMQDMLDGTAAVARRLASRIAGNRKGPASRRGEGNRPPDHGLGRSPFPAEHNLPPAVLPQQSSACRRASSLGPAFAPLF